MFGLKIVNKKSYLELQDELSFYKKLVEDKDSTIGILEGEVKGLRSEVSRLEKKVESLDTPKKVSSKETVLLTDVVETPLEVEKPVKKARVTKKTGTSTTRTKIVRKSE